ncbi:Wadjet anti-phage system protein JetD domain-containing protein [Clostridium pasteurianum]|uniref:Wadjet anti-phage system protein JetD domain-containing protein n=1 Tax=Clostridium pasteurianum TaxID=1501 RepID=UPI00039AE971|nr:Wadjet anti-phage system protein JetD domain-containing protein [Clostridium pasteurianum]
MKDLSSYSKKVIELDEIERIYKTETYDALCGVVADLIKEERLLPVKSSGGNGKKPMLYKKYRILEKNTDNSKLLDEINYKLSTKLSIEYYKEHIDKYKEHRKYILKLSDFIISKQHLLSEPVSMNERSFQIWGREKFLQKEGGKTIVKNLGMELEELNYYDTSEPLAYYSKSKETPQKILIIENKDTYYTMRRHLIGGGENILGEDISTLIYGGGKNINKAFNDYKISVEDYVSDSKNTILYFGDLDYEGIVIYEG